MAKALLLIGFLVVLLSFTDVRAQVIPIPMAELSDSMRANPKPALILLTTSWCSYCQMQKHQLKKNEDFHAASAYFHFTEFDAESTDDINFNGAIYRFKSNGASGGSHELALALGTLHNRLAFPTWIVLNENFEIVFGYPGVLKKDDLESLLTALLSHAMPIQDQ